MWNMKPVAPPELRVPIAEDTGAMKQKELTVVLCVIWAVSLIYGEMLAFWVPSRVTCSWPHHNIRSATPSNSTGFVKVAVLTDPQLMDKTSLGLAPKSLALEIAQFYTDLFMRRAFFTSILPFKPDVVLFLGDYLDGAPYLSDAEWQESYIRFKHIFGLNTQGRPTKYPVYYIPGNHDIGYASLLNQRPEVIRRYEKEFGIRNYQFTVGKVDFVAVDAQTVDGKQGSGHSQEDLASQTWKFVKNISKDAESHPRVLLTHIPLYRKDWTSCGPYRGSPVINQRISRAVRSQDITYQNYITEESSKQLLELIKPVLVLSGHDHDQCSVTHESKHGPVKEHTVGTISWQQGNWYPSFMLLSASKFELPNASSPGAVLTQLCFLPVQIYIYIWYLSLFALTLLALLLWPSSGWNFQHHFNNLIISWNIFGDARKEKNEDENCEYEMMWDAEGSMHLVKKTSNAPSPNLREGGSVESRGNAVMRPTAKKHMSQEIQVPINADLITDVDPMSTIPARTSKSKTQIVIQRLVRTFRMLTIIAAVNLPLYIMLLFKDWID